MCYFSEAHLQFKNPEKFKGKDWGKMHQKNSNQDKAV